MQNAFVVVPFFLWVLLNLFEIWVLPIQLFNLIYILWYCLIIVWLLASCLSMVRGPTEYRLSITLLFRLCRDGDT